MKTTRVMSLVAATVFALGLAGSAVAQTPTTPAPTPATAPAQPRLPRRAATCRWRRRTRRTARGGKQHGKKKHAAKKAEGDAKTAPETQGARSQEVGPKKQAVSSRARDRAFT